MGNENSGLLSCFFYFCRMDRFSSNFIFEYFSKVCQIEVSLKSGKAKGYFT
jgi:hypothetical protein